MGSRALLVPIFLVVLVDVFAFTLVIPLLPIYAERFGATPIEATLLVSVFAALQLVSGPILGRLSDRTGRKPLLLVSQVGTLLGFVLLAEARALWMLYVARMIDGATAGNISLAQAYISDHTPPKERARAFGVVGIAFGLGFFLGPFVTGYLSRFGLSAPIWAAAGLSLVTILCTAFFVPGGPPPVKASANAPAVPVPLRERPVLLVRLAQFFVFAFAFSSYTSGFALFAERRFTTDGHPWGPREIGYLFAYAGLLGIVLQGGLMGRLVARFGERALVIAGFAALALGYGALSLVVHVPWLVAITTFSALGQGLVRPPIMSLITQAAGPGEQGAVLGLNQSLQATAQMLAPVAAGTLIGHGLLGGWAAVASASAALGLVLAAWSARLAAKAAIGQPKLA